MPDRVCAPRLRLWLVLLVLLNLLFVHATAAVGIGWLLPLAVLTIAAPWLVRLAGQWWYRWVWSLGVVAIFAVLVHHAARAGVRYLLEDGLVLSVFCQVHLVCNLGGRHKPDLLFFNSFLIALVTSFFCQDLTFAGVFAGYALVLTLALQIYCAADHDDVPRLAWYGAVRAAVALLITGVVFLVCPRDFNREGLIGDTLRNVSLAQVGFTDHIDLRRSAKAVASDRIVLEAKLLSTGARDVPSYWRGATLVRYDRGRWYSAPRTTTTELDPRWLGVAHGRWLRPGHDDKVRLAITNFDPGVDRLCAPLNAHRVELQQAGDVAVTPLADGTLHYVKFDEGTLHYELSLHQAKLEHSAAARCPVSPELQPFLAVRPRDLPATAAALGNAVASAWQDKPQGEVVAALADEFARRFRYVLPGSPGAAASLEAFCAGEGGGHCELFATALALTLRSLHIPCRLVTGFASTEWDPNGSTLVMRSRHAHAWVEVRDPAGFWYTVDATPPSAAQPASATGMWASGAQLLQSWWDRVAGFDAVSRQRLMTRVLAAPGVAWQAACERPWLSATGALGLLSGLWILGRRRRAGPRALVEYRAALAAAGVQRLPTETPRELLQRADAEGLARAAIGRLQLATGRYELARFGPTERDLPAG